MLTSLDPFRAKELEGVEDTNRLLARELGFLAATFDPPFFQKVLKAVQLASTGTIEQVRQSFAGLFLPEVG